MKKFICGLLSAVIFFTGSVCFASHKIDITAQYKSTYSVVTESESGTSAEKTVASDLTIVQQNDTMRRSSGSILLTLSVIFSGISLASFVSGLALATASVFFRDSES